MSTLDFFSGDNDPPINGVIHDIDDPTVLANLTNATVKFIMRKSDDKRYTVNASATVVDAPNGVVQYQWGANDLDTPGEYQVWWRITWPDTRVQTTVPDTITVWRA